ncbi:18584_t:CDS:2 [Gigaspora margarita]|uniref:18584_t:CDS:1 n=1 Tax=Gigaspora margarita TaxID=4874 RepID=A0ABN7V2Q9_GIGMA|nr:18584_t:CDS:2 [Gigaspora margarita]
MTENEEKSIKEWCNSRRSLNANTLDHACKAYMKKTEKIFELELKSKKDKYGFERALVNQDKLLKFEVKDAKVLVLQRFRQKVLALENQRVTYLGNKQDRVEPANYNKNNIISRMDNKKEDKKIINLSLLDRKVIQNIEDDKNGEIVISEVVTKVWMLLK